MYILWRNIIAGIGKKFPKNTAFSVKTCRYRQENAIFALF